MKSDFTTQAYFPTHVKMVGFMMIFLGFPCLFINWIGAILSIVIGLFIITTKYGLMIDVDKAYYHDYLMIFFVKTGKEKRFSQIEKLFITSSHKTTKMQLRANSSLLKQLEYHGYVKFSDNDKVHVLSSTKKTEVLELVGKFAKDLSLPIEDLSKSE